MPKLNQEQLDHYARYNRRVDKCGHLEKRGKVLSHEYRTRYFELCGNLLFYYKTENKKEVGPVGVIFLEACTAEALPRTPPNYDHVFKISFALHDAREYFIRCPDEVTTVGWVKAISQAGYSVLRNLVTDLQTQLFALECRDANSTWEADTDADMKWSRRSRLQTRVRSNRTAAATADDVATIANRFHVHDDTGAGASLPSGDGREREKKTPFPDHTADSGAMEKDE